MQSMLLARRKQKTKHKKNEKPVAENSCVDDAECHCFLCELYSLQSKHVKSKILFSSYAILSTLSGMCFGINDVFFHKWCWYAKRNKYLRGAKAVHKVFRSALCLKLIFRNWRKFIIMKQKTVEKSSRQSRHASTQTKWEKPLWLGLAASWNWTAVVEVVNLQEDAKYWEAYCTDFNPSYLHDCFTVFAVFLFANLSIYKVLEFRRETKLHLSFTLDAGSNVHLLYPKSETEIITKFIDDELLILCKSKSCIHDHLGNGATKNR